MNIVYFSAINTNLNWGAETFLNRAFSEAGINTICIDYRENRNKMYLRLEGLNFEDIDYVFVQRGDYFPISVLKCFACPKIFWNSELVIRIRDNHHLLKNNLFDHILVRTEECKNFILSNNWITEDRLHIFLGAFDREIYTKQSSKRERDIDVLFIGSMTPRRLEWLEIIKKEVDVTFKTAFGDQQFEYFHRAKIILNIHGEKFLDTETRVYDVLGSGGLLVTEKLSSESPFKNGLHLVETDTPEGIIKLCKYYLDNDDDRMAIANRGKNECKESHTYNHRASEIRNLFNSIKLSVFQKPKTYWILRLRTLEFFRFYSILRTFHLIRKKAWGKTLGL